MFVYQIKSNNTLMEEIKKVCLQILPGMVNGDHHLSLVVSAIQQIVHRATL